MGLKLMLFAVLFLTKWTSDIFAQTSITQASRVIPVIISDELGAGSNEKGIAVFPNTKVLDLAITDGVRTAFESLYGAALIADKLSSLRVNAKYATDTVSISVETVNRMNMDSRGNYQHLDPRYRYTACFSFQYTIPNEQVNSVTLWTDVSLFQAGVADTATRRILAFDNATLLDPVLNTIAEALAGPPRERGK